MLPRPLVLQSSFILRLTLTVAAALTALIANPAFAQTPDALPGSGWVVVNEASPWSEPPEPEILTSVLDSISLTVDIPGFEVETVYHGSDAFQKLSFLGESFTSEVGKPELPVVRMMLAIPDCESYSVAVELGDSTEFSDATIWPVPSWAVGHQDEYEYVYEVFAIDEEFYEEDVLYPDGAAVIADDGWVRDQRYVILEIHPICYNPALSLLRCYSSVSVDVRFENPVETNLRGVGPLEPACRSVMANYDGVGGWFAPGGRGDSCDVNVDWFSTVGGCANFGTDYLMIVEDSIIGLDTIGALAEKKSWYDCLNVALVKVSDVASPIHPDSVKSFIQALYETESAANVPDGHLGYVLLIGDAREAEDPGQQSQELLPAYEVYAPGGGEEDWVPTDHWYACVADTDYVADLLIGRLAVGDTTELETEVGKILGFEPVRLSSEWANDIFLSCSFAQRDTAWRTHVEIVDEQEIPAILDILSDETLDIDEFHVHDYTCGDLPWCAHTEYGRPGNIDAVNDSVLVVVLWGHGFPCGSLSFKSADVDSLHNGPALPFWINLSCETGNFAYTADLCGPDVTSDCLGEHLMHWSDDGAIAFFGATKATTNHSFGRLVLEALYNDQYHLMIGQAVAEAKLHIQAEQEAGLRQIHAFNLLGDPTINLFLGEAAGYGSKPDLVIRSDVVVDPPTPSYDDLISFECRVTNESGCATPPDTAVVVVFDVYHADGRFSTRLTDTIGEMGSWSAVIASVSWSVSADSIGAYDVRATVDPEGLIPELFEENNQSPSLTHFYICFYEDGFPTDLPPGAGTVSPPTIFNLDGQGESEVVLAYTAPGHPGRVSVLDENGTNLWTFSGSVSGCKCPAIGDLDLDGLPEIVAAIPGPPVSGMDTLYVLNSETTPPDGRRVWKRRGTGEIKTPPAVADLTPIDGRPEVVIGDTSEQASQGRISVWNFAPADPALSWSTSLESSGGPWFVSIPPTVVNFGLHPADLVTWKECTGTAKLFCAVPGDVDPRWEVPRSDTVDVFPGSTMAAADLDRDGDLEIVTAQSWPPRILVREADDGTAVWSRTQTHRVDALTVGNLDADPELEVVVASRDSLIVRDHEGAILWTKSLPGDAVGEPLVADFDGGDDAEIIVGTTGPPCLCILKVPATGDTLEALVEPVELPGVCPTPAICDLDGDGSNDIVFTASDSQLHCLEYWGTSTPRFEWPMYRHDERNSGLYEQPVSGSVLESTTWCGDVLVRGDVVVDASATLRMAPGTTVRFTEGSDVEASGRDTAKCELIVEGRLHCVGGENWPIRLESDAAPLADPPDWYGVTLEAGAACTLAWSYLSDAEKSLWAISPDALTVHGCSFTNQSDIGVHLQDCGSSTSVEDCTISGCVTGVRMDSCSASILADTVADASVYGVLMQHDMGSTIQDNDIRTDAGATPIIMPAGIRVAYAEFPLLVQDNAVTVPDDGGSGLSLYCVSHDSARIRSNDVTGPGAGDATVCRGMRFGGTTATVRWNRLYEFNRYFQISGTAQQQGMPDLGDTSTSGGMNCTYDRPSGYYIYAEGVDAQLYAQNNWWGDSSPSAGKFYGSGVRIFWTPYLTSDPHESREEPDQELDGFHYFMAQNCPNPFNPVTTIRYGLAHGGRVTLRIYDLTGRVVRTLVDEPQPPGQYAVHWDGRNDTGQLVGSGVYFCRVCSRAFDEKRKLVLLK